MDTTVAGNCPSLFHALLRLGCLQPDEILSTGDGFFLANRSLSDILLARGITEYFNREGQLRQCDKFFDDWYLYVLSRGTDWVCSLVKMREQEHDAENGAIADGDTPGITVSFIAYDSDTLLRCLDDPSRENLSALNEEINRVVAARGQRHHDALKHYFCRPETEGPYLIARCYVHHVAAFVSNGCIPVPKHYATLYRENPNSRLPRFICSNNVDAGYTVCDHEKIFIRNPKKLTLPEAQAILATHTANTSLHSLAAEVRFHALFLTSLARLPLLRRFLYDSAIRADMLILDKEFQGPAPYYHPNSHLLRQQEKCHKNCWSI